MSKGGLEIRDNIKLDKENTVIKVRDVSGNLVEAKMHELILDMYQSFCISHNKLFVKLDDKLLDELTTLTSFGSSVLMNIFVHKGDLPLVYVLLAFQKMFLDFFNILETNFTGPDRAGMKEDVVWLAKDTIERLTKDVIERYNEH